MQVIVTGGREYDDWDKLSEILTSLSPTQIIEGGARGADRMARKWAIDNNIPYVTVEADWDRYGRMLAGRIRNREMLVNFPDATVVAFPGGNGTANCVAIASALKRTIIKVSK